MAQTVPFVDLKAQHATIQAEIRAAIDGVLLDASFILGPDVLAFEEEFAAYCGAAHCVGVGSGTAALELGMRALGIGRGDEVILPANTYIASALAVSHLGAQPVLVDVGDDYLASAQAVEAAITPRTKAIMIVHLYGRANDLDPIMSLAKRHGLYVVEDACQAHGAIAGRKRAGAVGDVGCFSFYPGKNLGAYGDGGAVLTNDAALADAIKLQRDFGQRRKYEHVVRGGNCRLDTLQAAVLRVKLRKLDEWNAKRIRLAASYDRQLAAAGIAPPVRPKDGSDVYHLYIVELPDRDAARADLSGLGIQTGIHYPIPIHLQPAYEDLGMREGSMPYTEAAANRLLSLPMYPELGEDGVTAVAAAVARHVEKLSCPA